VRRLQHWSLPRKAGQANATTAFCAARYFYLRLAHVVYLVGVSYVRRILSTPALVAEVVFWEVIR